MATGRRLEKINMLLQEELARVLDRESEFRDDALVTVTRVETSPDLHYAAVHVSIFEKEPNRTLEILGKNVYTIQQILNRRLRMRPVPKIRFEIDEGEMKREVVEKSLAELKKRGEV